MILQIVKKKEKFFHFIVKRQKRDCVLLYPILQMELKQSVLRRKRNCFLYSIALEVPHLKRLLLIR